MRCSAKENSTRSDKVLLTWFSAKTWALTVFDSIPRNLAMAIHQVCAARNRASPKLFIIAMVPVIAAIGAAIDYSRATAFQAKLTATLDAAVLAWFTSQP